MAQVAPLRAAELVSIMADLVQEWISAELVLLYHDPDNGQPVLFFKNQELGIRYTRETPSMFAPPPGYERTPQGLVLVYADTFEPAPDTTPVTPDQLATDSGSVPATRRSSADSVPATRRSSAGVSATAAKQQDSHKESKNQDPPEKSSSSTSSRARGQPDPRISGLGKALPGDSSRARVQPPTPTATATPSAASSRTRAQPDPRASPAAKGTVKPDVYQALREFGVAEPALSELSRNGIDRAMVDGWIAYLATQDMARPVGYLVKRLRAHQQPPPVPEEEDPNSYEALKRKYVPPGYEDVIIT
jgi:hypothetical protein